MTIQFNPPPGWPLPSGTWVPGADWLPDGDWPDPPEGWRFWSVSVPRRGKGSAGSTGPRLPSSLLFPIGSAASTVTLATLLAERDRLSAGGMPANGRPQTRAGREYYHPQGSPDAPGELPVDAAATPAELEATDARADGSHGTEGAERAAGILLSPLLRLVAHPSGLRVELRAGAVEAMALADVMTPAVEAATRGLRPTSARPLHGETADGPGGGTRLGGLRLLLGGRRGPTDELPAGRPAAARPEAVEARTARPRVTSALSLHELTRRALVARRAGDRDEALAVERDLCSLHRLDFAAIRPPTVTPLAAVTKAEVAALHQRALAMVGGIGPGLSRAETQERKAAAVQQAAELVRASGVARRVLAERREALATGAWQLLGTHDPAAVVAVVDEAQRIAGSEATCLDAGTDPVTGRAYVTVLLHFPTIDIVGDESREPSPTGRSTWSARSPRERNGAYAAGLASAVLATARHVLSIAPATDDVNVVVVRPMGDAEGVEPVYVGRLDRHDVSLRHLGADPMPLVTRSALPHGIRLHGPELEVTALQPAADADGALGEIVAACREAGRPVNEAAPDVSEGVREELLEASPST